MYRLERMELIGFKSFCDRTELKFPPGFTVVVGPNGCGKSNLGDALSWVLGEQSVRALRGTRMEDVIFGGTEGRRALGMAEVTVHLAQFGGGGSGSGREQAADLDMSGNGGDNGRTDATQNGTLVVSRRLFRSGESEYLMNGRRCRLRRQHGRRYRSYATLRPSGTDLSQEWSRAGSSVGVRRFRERPASRWKVVFPNGTAPVQCHRSSLQHG